MILWADIQSIYCQTGIRWALQNAIDKSTLAQVMAIIWTNVVP